MALPDFYEIDFLPVHSSRSGDAIAIRYQIGGVWSVHVVDGGYASTAPNLADHIRRFYGTNVINNVVVTHPDQDHVEGLAAVLEEFTGAVCGCFAHGLTSASCCRISRAITRLKA